MSHIYDFTPAYHLAKSYVVWTFKRFYGSFTIVGKENLPADGKYILAPNHVNALMDALALHSIVPRRMPLVFLARSDVFKNPLAARLMRFAKIMPAFRMRDGMENLGRNQEVFDRCVEILDKNHAIGIMPEGNQGEQKRIRPIVKGIFRIAFAAQEQYAENKGVKIIPVGIDYNNIFKFGKDIVINIGKPIEVSDYWMRYTVNPVTATNELRERLRNDLEELTVHIQSDDYYECYETVIDICATQMIAESNVGEKALDKFLAAKEIVARLNHLEKTNTAKMDRLHEICKNYRQQLSRFKLRPENFENLPGNQSKLILDGLLLLMTFPVFLQGVVLNALPFFVPVAVRKAMGVSYDGFWSSIQYSIGAIITFPLFYLLQLTFFVALGAPLWLVLLFIPYQYLAGKWAFRWYKEAKKWNASCRFRRLLKNNKLTQASNWHQQIIDEIFKIQR